MARHSLSAVLGFLTCGGMMESTLNDNFSTTEPDMGVCTPRFAVEQRLGKRLLIAG